MLRFLSCSRSERVCASFEGFGARRTTSALVCERGGGQRAGLQIPLSALSRGLQAFVQPGECFVDPSGVEGELTEAREHLRLRASVADKTLLFERPREVTLGGREVALTLLRAGAAVTALRVEWIKTENKALHNYMIDIIYDGGWNARVERHRRPLMSILSNLALPHDALVVVLSFWSPPGGR